MRNEQSAGGVVVRRYRGTWQCAVIQPHGRSGVWALPKGRLDPGESLEQAAVREVREETGLRGRLDECLGEVRYTFRADGARIHKTVTYFLLLWESGSPVPQAGEVEHVAWLDLEQAAAQLTYPGEVALVVRAAELLAARAWQSA